MKIGYGLRNLKTGWDGKNCACNGIWIGNVKGCISEHFSNPMLEEREGF
jgi:hypothetical protein